MDDEGYDVGVCREERGEYLMRFSDDDADRRSSEQFWEWCRCSDIHILVHAP